MHDPHLRRLGPPSEPVQTLREVGEPDQRLRRRGCSGTVPGHHRDVRGHRSPRITTVGGEQGGRTAGLRDGLVGSAHERECAGAHQVGGPERQDVAGANQVTHECIGHLQRLGCEPDGEQDLSVIGIERGQQPARAAESEIRRTRLLERAERCRGATEAPFEVPQVVQCTGRDEVLLGVARHVVSGEQIGARRGERAALELCDGPVDQRARQGRTVIAPAQFGHRAVEPLHRLERLAEVE